MGKSSHVFNLVCSLSFEEKVFFKKKYSCFEQKKVPLYIILFEKMDGTEERAVYENGNYNEDIIVRQIKNKKLIKNLSMHKNTLYEKILESLRQYHAKDNVRLQLNNLLQDIQILLKKELFSIAYKRLRQAKSLAIKYEYNSILLEILNLERRLARRYGGKDKTKRLSAISNKSLVALKDLSLHLKILNLYDFSFIQRNNEQLTKEEIEKKTSEIQSLNNDIDAGEDWSFHLKVDYHGLLFQNLYTRGNAENTLEQLNIARELFLESPHMITEKIDWYISLLYNQMNFLLRIRKYDNVPLLIEEMSEIIHPKKNTIYIGRNEKIHSRIFQILSFIKLSLELRRGDFSRAAALVPEIEKGLEKHHKNIPVAFQIMFFQNIAMAYFLNKEYPPVLDWVNRILTLEDSHKIKMNTRLLSRLLQIIVHYELEDYGLVADHLVPSFRKHLNRYKTHPEIKKYAPTYRILLSALSKASNATKDKKKKIFQDLAEQAREIPLFATILPWIEEKAKL